MILHVGDSNWPPWILIGIYVIESPTRQINNIQSFKEKIKQQQASIIKKQISKERKYEN